MRVCDLGCGSGRDLSSWGVSRSDEVVGLDIDEGRVAAAQVRFPERVYLHGTGERMPFPDASFDRVISNVALPYMNISEALIEIHRILIPGGRVSLSLHPPSFTISELIHDAMPKPVATLYRLYVLANGVFFHCTGTTLRFVNRRTESFQTERGMRVALHRAGLIAVSFTRSSGAVSEEFVVEARKPSFAANNVAA